MMHLPSLTDEELISIVRTKDDLVVTPMELELAERLMRAIDNDETNEKIKELEDELAALEEENDHLEKERDEAEARADDLEGQLMELKEKV